MESVSLFPKIHLELCDMQCKDDDLVIESSVTLKVRHLFTLRNPFYRKKNCLFYR